MRVQKERRRNKSRMEVEVRSTVSECQSVTMIVKTCLFVLCLTWRAHLRGPLTLHRCLKPDSPHFACIAKEHIGPTPKFDAEDL